MSLLSILLVQPLWSVADYSTSPDDGDRVIVSTLQEIGDDTQKVPCRNQDRQSAVIVLLKKMGAAEQDVSTQKLGTVENILTTLKGTEEGKVVVGAHYDKVSEGCGGIDNWTGVVTLARMYRTLKSLAPKKTFIFVAFGKEEEGLLGSRAMVKSIKKDEVAEYCAMTNIDSLGMGAPQVAENQASKKLLKRAEEVAARLKSPFVKASIYDGFSDAASFIAKGIPALDLHGLTNEWRRVLHSSNDKPSSVRPESVYLGYRVAVSLALDVDNSPCNTWR